MRQEPHYEPIHTTLVPAEMEPMHTEAEEVTEPDAEPYKEIVATPIEESPLPDRPMTIEEAERILIMRALERHGGNKTEAAEELNISPRTLYRKLQSYGEE